MRKLLATVLMAAFAGAAHAESYLKGGFPACATEALWERLGDLAAEDDTAGIQLLIDGQRCIMTRAGVRVQVLDKSLVSSTAKVRAFVDGQTALLWTDLRNLTDEETTAAEPAEPAPARSLNTTPFAPYFNPDASGEHAVEHYATSGDEHGFLFEPPLPEQDEVLEDAAEWVILNHHRDSRVAETVRYFSGGDLFFVRDGAKYRIKLIPEGDDQVGGLLIAEEY